MVGGSVDLELNEIDVVDESESYGLEDTIPISFDKSAYMEDILVNNLGSEFNCEIKTIPVEDIISGVRVRTETIAGLTASIKKFGLINPIVVMNTTIANKYVLIDGLRRLNGQVRAGKTQIEALIFKFSDLKKAKKALPILELIFNLKEPYSTREIWTRARELEKSMDNFTPDRIEFLFQLNAGDYTKLVDVMTSNEIAMAEIKQDLLEGKLSIEAAYKKLSKLRKEKTVEEKLAEQELILQKDEQDDLQSMVNTISDEMLDDDTEPDVPLSEDAIQALINSFTSDLGTVDTYNLEDLDRSKDIRKTEYQKSGERHPVDPALRRARMLRDDYTCQCCSLHGELHAYILDFHHILPVWLGGPDTIDNSTTACLNCHQLIHLYANGDLFIDFKTLGPEEVIKFKKIMIYGNVIIEAAKQKGKTRDDMKKEQNPHTVGRKFPGVLKSQVNKSESVGAKV